MKTHPAAEKVPLMSEQALALLTEDIREHGQIEPAVVFGDMLLDGRNRAAACKTLGIELRARTLRRCASPMAYVLSVNVKGRRHLSPTQLATIAASPGVLDEFKAEAAARQRAAGARGGEGGRGKKKNPEGQSAPKGKQDDAGRATTQAAKAAGAGTRGTKLMARTWEHAPDVAELAERGLITLSEVTALMKLKTKAARLRARKLVSNKTVRNITAAVQTIRAEVERSELKKRVAAAPTTPGVTIITGDAIGELAKLPAASVHCCVTDPPYGLEVHRTRRGGKDYTDGDLAFALLDDACRELQRVLTDDAHLYVFSGYSHLERFKRIIGGHFDVQDNPIVWVKNRHTMCDFQQWWASMHEYVIFARRSPARLLSASCSPDVIVSDTQPGHHSAAKPVAVLRQLIENSTVEGETVIDPFAGSGRTLLAARELERKVIGIEIDPEMADAMRGALA